MKKTLPPGQGQQGSWVDDAARGLSEHGFPGSDAIRHHDMDAAAGRPLSRDERAAVADAYDTLMADDQPKPRGCRLRGFMV